MTYIELGDICDISKGEIGITKAIPGEYPMVTTGAERKSHNAFQLNTEAVLVPLVSATGHGHASIKRIHFQEGKFAFGSILAACVPKDNNYSAKFLYIYFQLMKDYILVPLMKGSANVSLTLGNLKTAKVPDISREMQESIVKLYSTLKIEQDEAIGILLNQKSDIDSLRKVILQEAVQGKLTAKWREANPSIEHASELLKRIEAEKQQLIAEKKIKKEKPLSPIEDEDKPYDLPESWVWCRLNEVCEYIQRGKSPKYTEEPKIPVISQKCVQWSGFDISRARFITEESLEKYGQERFLQNGDLLWNSTGNGTIGRVISYPGSEYDKVVADSHVTVVRAFKKYIDTGYLWIFTASPLIQNLVAGRVSGSTNQTELGTSTVKSMEFSFPPLKEQQAIVEKVNSLMALCDELEQQVDNSQTQIEQLMQSCLKEVFEQESN